MAMSEKTKTALSAAVDPMKAKEHEIIEQYLEQLHADYDPVYSMLLNYECAVMEVETKFNILNNRLSIQGEQNPIESIKSRVKSLDSIIRKLEKLNLPIELESVEKNLKDVAGVRVVCSFVDDIYRIEKCFLEQEDVTLITRKDYIKNPKPSGYRSLPFILSSQGKLIGPGALITTITFLLISRTASINSFPECQASKSNLSPNDFSNFI